MSSFQPTDDVQSLRQQLASAQAKLQEFTDIIISQANELRILRDNRCQNCKKRFTPSPESSGGGTALLPPPIHHSSPANRKPFWRRILGQPSPIMRRDSISQNPSIQLSESITESLPTPKSSSVKDLSRPIKNVTASSPTEAPIPSESKVVSWSVEYQAPENRAIDVTLVSAFKLEAGVISARFSPDGKHLAVSIGQYTGKTFVYNVESAKQVCVLREPSKMGQSRLGVGILCFSPDGRHLVTAVTDSRVNLWKISESRVRSVYGHKSSHFAALDISLNGRFLAGAVGLGIIIWRIRDGSKKIIRDDRGSCSFIKFSPNGRYIVTVYTQNTLTVWNTRTGHLVATWTNCMGEVEGLRGRYNMSHQFWTLSSVGVNTSSEETQEAEILLFTGHRNGRAKNVVAVSPDGRWVVSDLANKKANIWDLRDDSTQCSLLGHGQCTSVDFSPMGKYLVVGDDDHVCLWSYKLREETKKL